MLDSKKQHNTAQQNTFWLAYQTALHRHQHTTYISLFRTLAIQLNTTLTLHQNLTANRNQVQFTKQLLTAFNTKPGNLLSAKLSKTLSQILMVCHEHYGTMLKY